ncbi:MAG: hypothetical protein K5872_22105 [Rhizobiaceae bacterium]|nr:hypothetical protein [Rhizobiaceae bacterium]MCV0408914.1 hypothetical protein [Rhizobiaceae bacterium]
MTPQIRQTPAGDQNAINAWLARNGGPRRIEPHATSDIYDLKEYLAGHGVTLAMDRSYYTVSGQGIRRKRLDRAGLFTFVDQYRIKDGLEPFKPRPRP